MEAKQLRRQMQLFPSLDTSDPDYRRLRYIRYADNILLAFSGARNEAEEIKSEIGKFLCDQLKLALSATKTLITHAKTGSALFLGYDISVLNNNRPLDQRGHCCINGQIGLKVPMEVVNAKCNCYLRHGKPIHRPELIHDSAYSIVAQYQQMYRGVVEYYRLAFTRQLRTALLAVTSGGVIAAVFSEILGLSNRAMTNIMWNIDNCSLTAVVWSHKGRSIRYSNQTGHLPPELISGIRIAQESYRASL